ncbi:MAG TPA: phosphopyruvate hydratase [bacterium]|nr:phosphopyruvate hydratase [bacterium]HOR57421.1 phosphopyruvate hydratase [bacterium]HPL55881.1 phosphopyruvate hydratase [bacterium]
MTISKVLGNEILDSRGNPTVEARLVLDNGSTFLASVPSGKSTGSREAHELRDNDESRYGGNGVLRAVGNINSILSPALVGVDPLKQVEIDNILKEIDGTDNKKKIGANAILATSLAVAKAGAYVSQQPLYQYLATLAGNKHTLRLPVAMFNLINGGEHADNNLEIQEFMVVPSNTTFRERLRSAVEQYQRLHSYLRNRGYSTGVGDEGGYAPNLINDQEAIDALRETGNNRIAFDFAGNKPSWLNYHKLIGKGDILSLEDPLPENDWDGWRELSQELSDKVMIVGDDLFVTNSVYLRRGIEKKIANAILIKPNQIGTLTETLDVIKLAQKNNYKIVVSHRSGETEDTFIADLAVGAGAEYIKDGAPARGERVAKYNRLLRIEDELQPKI